MALVTCPECGAQVSDKASSCPQCGCPIAACRTAGDDRDWNKNRTVIIERPRGNGVGTAGFVMSVLALIFSWAPVAGWLIWAIGLVLSFVGMFRTPRGLAVAGFIISIIGVVLILLFMGVMASMLAF